MKTLSNHVYDWAKAIGQLLLPAILTFITDVCNAMSYDPETVVKIFASFILLYNAFITAWNKVYHDQQAQESVNDFDTNESHG